MPNGKQQSPKTHMAKLVILYAGAWLVLVVLDTTYIFETCL
jgi:hypothetical protein